MKVFLAVLLLTASSFAQISNGSVTTYTTGTGSHWQSPIALDVRNYGGADICAQITNAMAALPAAGGTILVPAGNHAACAGSGGIAIAITKPGVILQGMGSGSPMGPDVGATTINLAAGVTGIDITGGRDHVQDLFLMSASGVLGTDDGVRVRGASVTLTRVSVKHFGRYGINVDGGNSGGSADLWHFEDVESVSNFSDGFHWSTPCSDNNLGTGIQLNSSLNVGWGYNIACGQDNYFLTTHASTNTAGGYMVSDSHNMFNNTYAESGTGSSFVIASGLTGVNVSFNSFGQPTTITNPGASALANHINYFSTDGWQVQNGLLLGDQPGAAGNATYILQVGSGGLLNLQDYATTQSIFTYDPSSRWTFGQRVVHTPNATLPGLNIGSISGDPSTPVNGDMWYDSAGNKFRCYENGAPTDCIGVSGAGTVTHTAGPLTALKMMIGNGAADATIDPSTTSDGAGNIVLTSIQTAGANGGLAGVEGNGSGLTPAVGQDLLYADSTSHCWHQNLNNTDGGCALRSLGAGTGSVFGTTAVNTITQADQTPWALTFQNTVATGASAGGLGMYVSDTGDSFIVENTLAGVVTASVGLRQNGELLLDGNGAAGDPAAVQFSIPNVATADFLFQNGSSVTTGSPRIRIAGKTSGEGIISVAAVAGTPNPILLPTATGSANAILKTDGANPQQASWTLAPALTTLSLTSQFTSTLATGTAPLVITSTTPVANLTTVPTTYNHSGTQQTATHLVRDRCTLGTDCSVTLSGSAVYTSSSTYDCVAIDRTGANAIQFAPSSGSAFALTGTGTDTISYVCVGN